ncbi:mas-related G-protein coupled receptor member X4 [Daubentonia madagascariensis]|uniref:Mas-related G-protein coupled receptor member X4 n=1 Tax=Daubentonia madagascariensis TaxID=31869 RepID=A0ABD2FBV2_DAUMA
MEPTIPAWSPELTPRKGSNETRPVPCDSESLIITLLTLIFALVGLAGNTVVLWLLGFRMRRNAFSVYILNLAAADFLFLCGRVTRSLRQLVITSYLQSYILSTVMLFPYLAGLSMLSAISAERCLSVLWPIWYRCRRPRHQSAVTCALLWALSLLLSTLEFSFCHLLDFMGERNWCQTFHSIICAWLIVLLVVLCGSSLALLSRFLRDSWRMRMSRLYVTILLTVLVFLVCGLPLGIYWFLYVWMQNDVEVFCRPVLVFVFLTSVNSSANPIIYFFVGSFRQRRQDGRQTLKRVLQRALQDAPEVDECTGSLPRGSLELSESRQAQ